MGTTQVTSPFLGCGGREQKGVDDVLEPKWHRIDFTSDYLSVQHDRMICIHSIYEKQHIMNCAGEQ